MRQARVMSWWRRRHHRAAQTALRVLRLIMRGAHLYNIVSVTTGATSNMRIAAIGAKR